MSVHDDGPPNWKKTATATPPPASSEWVSPIEKRAKTLLAERIADRAIITSLDFKVELRMLCADLEPAPKIVQEDVSRFLKHWFLGVDDFKNKSATKAGYAFKEHHDGGPSKDKTYNEYFYAPELAARAAESALEEKIVAAQHSGETRWGRVKAWIRKTLGPKQ